MRARLDLAAAAFAAATLLGCALPADVQPTYEALERGFRWQCEGSADLEICVRHKFLALQERRNRQLTINECAVTYGWAPRARWSAQCRNVPAPQTIECRTAFGKMTCTIADDAP